MMKITQIAVDNFKSLVDFRMPLADFTCLVGLNGVGKSTVLQFFDFVSQQMRGDLQGWLKKRSWDKADINSKLVKRSNITFEVSLETNDNIKIIWSGSFNRTQLRCTKESVIWGEQRIFSVESGSYSIIGTNSHLSQIRFKYEGSLLSQLRDSEITDKLAELKRFFVSLHALDLLAPELMRQRTRSAKNSLGLGGERLSAFLHEIGEEKRIEIKDQLTKVYPQLHEIEVSSLRSGWKQLAVLERYNGATLHTEARHIADGVLRMVAIFAQLSKEQSFLLLDEIENGVNPELIEFLVDSLVQATPQVLVTTHSPMILNFLEDEVAIAGVIYLYKRSDGATQAKRFFDIPSMWKKLTVMGPGEVYEDTLLTQLIDEIEGLAR